MCKDERTLKSLYSNQFYYSHHGRVVRRRPLHQKVHGSERRRSIGFIMQYFITVQSKAVLLRLGRKWDIYGKVLTVCLLTLQILKGPESLPLLTT